jgi:hypothetical protein
MCAMTEKGLRATAVIGYPGSYLVSRGKSCKDVYIRYRSDDDLKEFKPLYKVNVKSKYNPYAQAVNLQDKNYQDQLNRQWLDRWSDYDKTKYGY